MDSFRVARRWPRNRSEPWPAASSWSICSSIAVRPVRGSSMPARDGGDGAWGKSASETNVGSDAEVRSGGGGDTVDDKARATVGSYSGSPRHGPKVRGRDGRRSTLPEKTPIGRGGGEFEILCDSVASRTSDQLTVLVGRHLWLHPCLQSCDATYSASASALGYVRVRAVPLRRSLFPKRLLASSPVSARVSAKCM